MVTDFPSAVAVMVASPSARPLSRPEEASIDAIAVLEEDQVTVEAVAFAGGIGENSALVRRKALAGLDFLGISLDEAKNESTRPDCELTGAGSRARIFAIATNEEIVVARKAKEFLERRA